MVHTTPAWPGTGATQTCAAALLSRIEEDWQREGHGHDDEKEQTGFSGFPFLLQVMVQVEQVQVSWAVDLFFLFQGP
jgi:hypothetical protein